MIPKSRPNELTGIIGRERFDDPPGTITSDVDYVRWVQFRARYHEASKLIAPDEFPLQVDFETTSACNFRCVFCPHGQGLIPKRLLGWDRFERGILEGEQYGLVSIKLNYINEPLLTKDLPEHIRFAMKHGVLNTYFATNGSLLNERKAEELIDAGASKVMISLDATTPETFLKVRQAKNFDLIIRNIHGLLALREKRGVTWPLVRVNFLKTELNAHEAEDFVSTWTGVADAIGFQDQVGLPGMDEEVFDGANVDHSGFKCAFPSRLLVVDAGGSILPCCTFSGREMPLGSIDSMTLHEAWKSKQLDALRLQHSEGTWRDNPVCLRCVTGCA